MNDPTSKSIMALVHDLTGSMPADEDENLIEGGHIDSFVVVEFVECLEDLFGVAFKPVDMRIDNFLSVRRMTETVAAIQERGENNS